jgi:hypothetical protein
VTWTEGSETWLRCFNHKHSSDKKIYLFNTRLGRGVEKLCDYNATCRECWCLKLKCSKPAYSTAETNGQIERAERKMKELTSLLLQSYARLVQHVTFQKLNTFSSQSDIFSCVSKSERVILGFLKQYSRAGWNWLCYQHQTFRENNLFFNSFQLFKTMTHYFQL